jgi:hypothetical protein
LQVDSCRRFVLGDRRRRGLFGAFLRALQQETAAARRLHYWRASDHYELSRVALHSDYRP